MPSIGDFFKQGSIGEQLLVWGVLNQIISSVLTPAITEIVQRENQLFPLTPLTAEQAAVAAVREIMDNGNAQSEASLSGIDAERFSLLTQLASTPPALELILEAYRRDQGGISVGGGALIDMDKALADIGISSQYRSLVKALAISVPDTSQILLAWLTGQIPEDEARSRLITAGMDPTWIDSAYNAEGQAPTPVELLELWNRGIIPESGTGAGVVSYDQGFLEGPWRNKWLDAFKALRVYVPPPRTVTALLRNGTIDQAQALAYFEASGLSPETAAQYVADASHHATAAQRALTQAQVIDLYESKLISQDEAQSQLVALKFTASDARLLLALADQKSAAASIKSATTRLRDLYLAGTNDATTTTNALHTLGIPDAQVTQLLAVWNLEQTTATKSLSASEIASALEYSVLDQPTAMARLTVMGYNPHDAWIILSTRAHGPLPDEPGA